jgi:hypothetical protein
VCSTPTIWDSFGGFYSKSIIRCVSHFLCIIGCPEDNWDNIKQYIYGCDFESVFVADCYKNDILDFLQDVLSWKKYKKLSNVLSHYGQSAIGRDEDHSIYKQTMKKIFDTSAFHYNGITNEDIINYIEFALEPTSHNIVHFNMDENFKDNMKKHQSTSRTSMRLNTAYTFGSGVQVWCEGPVLLKKVWFNEL